MVPRNESVRVQVHHERHFDEQVGTVKLKSGTYDPAGTGAPAGSIGFAGVKISSVLNIALPFESWPVTILRMGGRLDILNMLSYCD